jgi:hypothetical protein
MASRHNTAQDIEDKIEIMKMVSELGPKVEATRRRREAEQKDSHSQPTTTKGKANG